MFKITELDGGRQIHIHNPGTVTAMEVPQGFILTEMPQLDPPPAPPAPKKERRGRKKKAAPDAQATPATVETQPGTMFKPE